MWIYKGLTDFMAFIPQVNYTDQPTTAAACRQN
jgi:hypothetical protein